VSCFVFVVLVGGWGFSCFGGCSGCPPGFLVLGFGVVCLSCSSWFFCAVVRGCGGRVAGGSGSGGRCGAPGSSVLRGVLCPVRGGGLGVLGPVVVKWFRGGRVASGSSSALLGGGGGWACFFRSALSVLLVPVLVFVVLSGLGVLGGVGLGWGFFSGFCCSARAGAGMLLGAVVGCAVFMALFHRVLRVRGAGLCDIVDNFPFWAVPPAFHTFFHSVSYVLFTYGALL